MAEFRVTLGYQATFMPFYGKDWRGNQTGSLYPGHHGLDLVPTSGRAKGYPIKINGVQIGTMGDTGAVTGAHLHVDKSIDGSRAYSSYRNPSDWQGITGRVTFAGWAGTAGNMVKILASNGHIYRALHLDRIDVKVGDTIKANKGGAMASRETINQVFKGMLKRNPDAGAIKTYASVSDALLVKSVYESGERKRLLEREAVERKKGNAAIKALANVQKTINDLKTRPTKADLEAAVSGVQVKLDLAKETLKESQEEIKERDAQIEELKKRPASDSIKVDLGANTQGWIEKLINIFRSK